jgi:hypothetical protein
MTVQRGRPRGIATASHSSMGFVESRDRRRTALLIDLLDLLDAGQEVGEDVGQLGRDEPFIVGAEISHGIQYYQASRHLTDEDDRGADNYTSQERVVVELIRVPVGCAPMPRGGR